MQTGKSSQVADVIREFQKAHPEVGNIAVITLPPGILLKAIIAGGWSYEGKDYAMEPDIYASVNMGHLGTLKAKGKMDKYMIYTHNALELMVAKGNPEHIKGIDDLGRNDLRIMLPNPITEGIMTFYANASPVIRHPMCTSPRSITVKSPTV
jgi:hypothetical protein